MSNLSPGQRCNLGKALILSSDFNHARLLMEDTRQQKLTSVDFLLLILINFSVIPERIAFKTFQGARYKLFHY